ncbi:DUF6230 family protein [Rhodococcus sp. IEGM 1401]|uniref:DUF6230 family protein n=1 Tax=unclassified Rhodococcus (in: high G+C Gram-positive bacteria) TaxID=192944 RepID=UPI0022B2D80C|nr:MULTISPECIES: DUF6230 family protein [unclassified Rhodococcus (in: high G+C Gram-positive bacteria)]MCZ4560869.1 DUF6230 family protein [Rhodococcus sp. IEGM 1401]MDI9921009.1 DUF6230 family protein [Rhodococcus sp. IEGM 1372]MDV8033390.1 DUF6230 family protein [Rhodococcus sp. IEGM 1414]
MGAVGLAIIGGGIATGQLPVNLALSGQPFIGTVSAVGATGITVYPRAVSTAAGEMPSIAVKLDQVELSDVCLSTSALGIPFLGDVTLFARVPGANTATADGIVLDASSVGGSVSVADVRLGLDASALGEVTGTATSAVTVGQSSAGQTRVEIITLTATGASLENLAVSVESGDRSC